MEAIAKRLSENAAQNPQVADEVPEPPKNFPHSEWNKMYSAYESPYPQVQPNARRIDLAGAPPGKWAFPTQVNNGTEQYFKFAKFYYDRNPTSKNIVRTLGGKGKVKELKSEGVTLTLGEAARFAKVLVDWLVAEGVPIETILADGGPEV